MTLDEKRLPRADVVQHGASNRLLRVADSVVYVNHGIPILAPVDRFRVLHNNQYNEHSQLISQSTQSVSQLDSQSISQTLSI